MSFFKKLGLGLKKSSAKITTGITDIFTKKRVDEETINEFEDLLFTSDLGVKATYKIIEEFRKTKLDKDVTEQEIKEELANQITTILKPAEKELKMPYKPEIILMVGVNGAGKTTTIGKIASKLKAQGKQVSLIAGDTFRAAAVEQLKEWGKRSNVRVFSGAPNVDAAGLIFDGINEAVKQGDDIVFVDTAGRLQNKSQLMDELAKIVRVIKKVIPDAPHETILCLDATTGQNAVDQVKIFKEMVNVSGIVMTKLDGTGKGGVLISIVEESNLPVYYIGIGEAIDDLDIFKADEFAKNLVGLQ
jgi:fused signal recognition particle receptor